MDRQRGQQPGGGAQMVGRAIPPRRQTLRRWIVLGLLTTGFMLCALVFLGAIGASTGFGAGALGVLFASLPLGVVVPAFLWVDRLESEPRRLLLLALAWGGVVATAIAVVANTTSAGLIQALTGTDPTSTAAVAVAPVVEETAKGLGLLLILRLQRREFDGVVDGIVYAGLIGAGFAFGENILYLGRAFNDAGTDGLLHTLVLRAVVGPFAHPLFTCCTGVAVGLSVYRRAAAARVGLPVLGWVLAVLLHAAWNLSAFAGEAGFYTAYLLLQVPVFLVFVGLAWWARRREARLVVAELQPYAAAGWLTPSEAALVGSPGGRRQALLWADRTGGRGMRGDMDGFLDAASDLALLRHRIRLGDVDQGMLDEERRLLGLMAGCRARVASTVGQHAVR